MVRRYTEKSDLWSIGVILYQMLTAGVPYKGTNVLELVADIQAHEPVLPERVKISADLKDLMRGLLERNPDLRITWTEFFLHPCLNIMGLDTANLPDDVAESVRIVQVEEDKELTEARETLRSMRAELELREQELRAAREELGSTKQKLALTEDVVEEMASRILSLQTANEEAKAAKLLLENRTEELKAQVLLLATNRLAEDEKAKQGEEAEARYEEEKARNKEMTVRLEALETQLEVYRVALVKHPPHEASFCLS